MKRIIKIITMLSFAAVLAIPAISQAGDKKVKNEIVMKMGNKVHLFHSGKVDAQKEIAIGDVITVYREVGKTPTAKEVGQVTVLSFIGEHYFEAEIVKGEVKVGDIAKKDAASLLVQPAK